jgi:hypothetical protein
MKKMVKGGFPAFNFKIEHKEACQVCLNSERPVMKMTQKGLGLCICEFCASLASLAWRHLPGEIPVGFEDRGVESVRVLICRRRQVPNSDTAQMGPMPMESKSSYEFLCCQDETDETVPLDLPGKCNGRMDPVASALEALRSLGLKSWRSALEPLYDSFSPRGRLIRIFLARAWGALEPNENLVWVPWPLAESTGPMAGFYGAMESVWDLRLYKHGKAASSMDLCVQLNKASMACADLQLELLKNATADSSMLAVYQAAMSAEQSMSVRAIVTLEKQQTGIMVVRPRGEELESSEETEETIEETEEGEAAGSDSEPEFEEDDEDTDDDTEFVQPRK